MTTTPFSIRLDTKLKARLEKEAKRRDRTAGYIASRAIKLYFEQLDFAEQEIDAAFAEADKGVFISGEKVLDWMKSWGGENELQPPESDILPAPKNKKKAA